MHYVIARLDPIPRRKPQISNEIEEEAERCFLKAIDIARPQQAKSLELRAVMSLIRPRQQQAMQHVSHTIHHEAYIMLAEGHTMLSDIYH